MLEGGFAAIWSLDGMDNAWSWVVFMALDFRCV